MDYTFLVRKKHQLSCPYCGSLKVAPLFQHTPEEWLWGCEACKRTSNYKYTRKNDRTITGVALFRRGEYETEETG